MVMTPWRLGTFMLKILMIPVTLALVVRAMILADVTWVDEAKWNMLLMTVKVDLNYPTLSYPAYLMILSCIMICMHRWGNSLQQRGERRPAKGRRTVRWRPMLPWNQEPPDPMSKKEFQHRARKIQKRAIGTKSAYRKAKRLSKTTMLLMGLQAMQLASRQVPEFELC
jgi:hypothetical protein